MVIKIFDEFWQWLKNTYNQSKDKMKVFTNFLNTKLIVSIIAISFLLITLIWSIFWELNKALYNSIYEIKFYTTEEAEEKFWYDNVEDNTIIIEQLLNFWSVFTYDYLNNFYWWVSWNWNDERVANWELLSDLVEKNINNYNNDKLNFDQIWDTNTELITNIKKIRTKYNLFWNSFNNYIFQNSKTDILDSTWNISWNVFKDILQYNWSTYTRISCLMKNQDTRTINENWICSWIWYYVALKEFLLEQNDINISFPIEINNKDLDISINWKSWQKLYIKKFKENWQFTETYNIFISFLNEKNITNIFYVTKNNKEWEFLKWLKKTYFYEDVFKWVLEDESLSNLWSWNSIELFNIRQINKSDTENNKKNNTNYDQIMITENNQEENWQSFEINNVDIKTISILNYSLTKDLTTRLWNSFNNVLTIMLNSENEITNWNWECIMKNNTNQQYVKYDSINCNSIINMKWWNVDNSLIWKFLWTDSEENITYNKISTVNYEIPWFWISIDWNTAWIYVAWIQKWDNRDFYWLKKIYFPQSEKRDIWTWPWQNSRQYIINKLFQIVWPVLWLAFIFLYYWSYMIILLMLWWLLAILFNHLSSQFTEKEQIAKNIQNVKAVENELDRAWIKQ